MSGKPDDLVVEDGTIELANGEAVTVIAIDGSAMLTVRAINGELHVEDARPAPSAD